MSITAQFFRFVDWLWDLLVGTTEAQEEKRLLEEKLERVTQERDSAQKRAREAEWRFKQLDYAYTLCYRELRRTRREVDELWGRLYAAGVNSISKNPREMKIDELEIKTRMRTALKQAGFETVEQIVRCPARELLEVRSFGPVALKNLKMALAQVGLKLAEDDE